MAFKTLAYVALASCFALTLASPVPADSDVAANQTMIIEATCKYSGPYANFPPKSKWIDYATLFNKYKQSVRSTGDTASDVDHIDTAIKAAAHDIGVEERVIFAIIIQESSGNVGVKCTPGGDGKQDCGLMQCEDCKGFPGKHGLSQSDVSAMINGGTNHYKLNLKDFGNKDEPSSIYPALREYNSGEVDQSNLSIAPHGYGVPCYVSDIARRLQGEVF